MAWTPAWTNRPQHPPPPLVQRVNAETNFSLSRQSDIMPPGIANVQPHSRESFRLPPPPTVATLISAQQLSDHSLATSNVKPHSRFNSQSIPQLSGTLPFLSSASGLRPPIENISKQTILRVPPVPTPAQSPLQLHLQPQPQLQPQLKLPLELPQPQNRSAPQLNSLTPSKLYSIKSKIQELELQLKNEIEKSEVPEYADIHIMQESKNMDIEAEATAEQSTTRASVNDPGYISVSKNVDLIKDKIKRLQGELTPENLKVVSWKIANASKRKERRKRKIKEMQLFRDTVEERRAKLSTEIDRKCKNILSRDRKKEKKKMARQSSKLEKRQMLREGGSIGNKAFILVQKLQQLKDLRRQRLKKEGHFFPEEDEEFFQRVRKAEEAQVILENIGKSRKDKQPKQHDSTGVTAVSQTLECEPMVNVKRKLSEAMAVDTTVTKLDSVDPTSDSQAKYRKVSYVQQDLKVDTVQDQEESEDQRQFSREQVKIKEDPSTLTNRTRPPNVHDQPKRPIPIDPALIQPSIEKKEARLQKNRKIWEVYQVFPKMGTREAKRASSVSVELEEPPDTPSSEAWIKFLQSGKFDALHVS